MADISSLYPQPPAAQQPNVLSSGDPSKILGLIGQAQDIQKFQAAKAAGEAAQSAIDPTGNYDPTANMNALRNNPNAALVAPEAIRGILERQGQQIEQRRAQALDAATLFGGLADEKSPTALDVHKRQATAATIYPNLPAPVIAGMGNHVLSSGDSPEAIKRNAATLKNMAVGAAGTSARTPGPPAPSGAPTNQSIGAANYGGTQPTGLPPGEEPLLASPAQRAADLQATATTSPQYHADLDNLKQLSKTLEIGGPTVEVEKKLAQLGSRFGIGTTISPEQLKSVEEFDKIAKQISTAQASGLGAGTDAGRNMVVGANPSSSMSAYGREGVIDMLQGNQDWKDAGRRAWLRARANGAAASSYDQFAETYGETSDPRVFQFNRMSRENQQKFLHNMPAEDIPAFEEHYKTAVANKWVKPLKAPDDAK